MNDKEKPKELTLEDSLKDAGISWENLEKSVLYATDRKILSGREATQLLQIAQEAKRASSPFVATQMKAQAERAYLSWCAWDYGVKTVGPLDKWIKDGKDASAYRSMVQSAGLPDLLTKLGIAREHQAYLGVGRE